MKRLLLAVITAFAFLLQTVGVEASTRYWTVDIYQPSATTNKTLNVEYKVVSTIAEDDFTVELFENNISKGSQNVTTSNGDSGVFTIALPSAGTYSYYVVATNSGAEAPKTSKTVSVQVSNAPEPTVTTITRTTATPTAANNAAAAGGANQAAGAQNAGAVAAAGTTTPEAASTTVDNAGNSDVLGAEATRSAAAITNNTARDRAIGSLAVLAGAGILYALYRRSVAKEL